MGNQQVNELLTLRLGAHKNPGNTDPHPMRGDVDEFCVYTKALSDAEATAVMNDENAQQKDVQSAVDTLLNAMQNQLLKADKTALKEAVVQAEKLDLDGYTAQSVETFQSALQHAQPVLADENLSKNDQSVVDEAMKQLRTTMDGLTAEPKPEPSAKPQSPETGDSSSIVLLTVAMLSSAACAGTLWIMKRKRNYKLKKKFIWTELLFISHIIFCYMVIIRCCCLSHTHPGSIAIRKLTAIGI